MSTYEETFLALFKPFSIIRFGFHKRSFYFFYTPPDVMEMSPRSASLRPGSARLGPAGEIKASQNIFFSLSYLPVITDAGYGEGF